MADWMKLSAGGLLASLACANTERGPSNVVAGQAGDAGAGQGSAGGGQASSAGSAVMPSAAGSATTSTGGAEPAATGGAAGNAAGGSPASAGQASAGATENVAGEAGGGGRGEPCTQVCQREPANPICGDDEVAWRCDSINFDKGLFDAECESAPTGAIRYCCPAVFQGECG